MPTEEQTYRKGVTDKLEEISNSLEEQNKAFTEQRDEAYRTSNSLSRIEIRTESIEKQATYTNGKVRKIIIALVFLGGIVIGQQFANWHDIIGLIASAV
jgi:hypothetical protein